MLALLALTPLILGVLIGGLMESHNVKNPALYFTLGSVSTTGTIALMRAVA